MTAPKTPAPRRPALRLTPRGRVVLAVLGLVVVLALSLLIRSCTAKPAGSAAPSITTPSAGTPGTPTTTTAASTSGATSTPAATRSSPTTASPSGATMPGPRQAAGGGIRRSGTTGDGTWTAAPTAVKPARQTPTVHRYAVKVERGTGIDAMAASREIAGVLNDPRGWIGYRGASFELVPDAHQAEFTIYVASPPTTNRMCQPLQTLGLWSCRHGDDVILNSDRWTLQTPSFTDVAAYRAYLVNHEVGHFLGHGHRQCGGKGQVAPVMMQQSKGLAGCTPNPWPTAGELSAP